MTDFTPEAIDALCARAERMGSPESAVVMLALGGAVAREQEDSAAYTPLQAGWELNAQARWHEPAEDDTHIAWSRRVFDAMARYCTGGVYVNFISREEGVGLIREAYGAAVHQRLLAIKRKWDPDNAFHHNQNIDPAG